MKTFTNRLVTQFNGNRGQLTVQWNEQAETEPVEILIYEDIGVDPWDGTGLSPKDFKAALDAVPKGRGAKARINSPGGSVWDGMTMRNLWNEFKGRKEVCIDGIAASTASWMLLDADEVCMPKGAQMFIHDAWGIVIGNAKDCAEMAGQLDKTSDQIADFYANKSGKPASYFRDLMKAETLMTGEECKAAGLIDRLTDDNPVTNFTSDALATMKNRLAVVRNSVASLGAGKQTTKGNTIMDKTKMLALLNKWGVTVPENATDEQLMALIEAGPAKAPENKGELETLKNEIAELTRMRNEAKKREVTDAINQFVNDDKVSEAEKEAEIKLCIADESRLTILNARQPRTPGVQPVNIVITENSSAQDLVKGYNQFQAPMNAWKRGNDISMKSLSEAAINKGLFIIKNAARLGQMMNANTIAAELKRSVILQSAIVDFRRILLQLNQFSTVFQNVPLEGTNKVEVPFYDLDSSASTEFVLATGYTTIGNTTTDKREITIGTGATDGARLFQALSFTSEEFARQPYLKIQQLATLKAEKLAYDIVTDVLGVVTAANYGAAGYTGPAATMLYTDVVDLSVACKTWPQAGRRLFVSAEIDGSLRKDAALRDNSAFSANVAQDAVIPKLAGFDYIVNPNIPSNSENLIGFAAFMSAILVATAPVPPREEVRNNGTTYELVVDPQTGIAFEYRTMGDSVTDKAIHVIECSYGFAKGNGNALKRIVSA